MAAREAITTAGQFQRAGRTCCINDAQLVIASTAIGQRGSGGLEQAPGMRWVDVVAVHRKQFTVPAFSAMLANHVLESIHVRFHCVVTCSTWPSLISDSVPPEGEATDGMGACWPRPVSTGWTSWPGSL